jgi:hypothetical protein
MHMQGVVVGRHTVSCFNVPGLKSTALFPSEGMYVNIYLSALNLALETQSDQRSETRPIAVTGSFIHALRQKKRPWFVINTLPCIFMIELCITAPPFRLADVLLTSSPTRKPWWLRLRSTEGARGARAKSKKPCCPPPDAEESFGGFRWPTAMSQKCMRQSGIRRPAACSSQMGLARLDGTPTSPQQRAQVGQPISPI